MDELRVIVHPKWAPACESGRHLVHPFTECDEVDLMSAAFAEMYERALTEAFTDAQAEADAALLYGNGTGDMRGFLNHDRREPTSMERALAILAPELRRCLLYQAGAPRVVRPARYR
ncbi:hypothetical protein [Streptomyces shenzhenensis]|uniref:hypothetical protein n=1 Tax=Streptomyces shenzhenensis TaxID=943815 RepID=UPI00369E1B13